MKPLLIRFLATVTVAVPLIALASVDQARERSRPAAKASLTDAYGQLPLQFEANGGRTDKRVDFIARGRGYSLFLTRAESVLSLVRGGKTGVVRVGLDGAATGRGR